ncbi:unnamed protein product [Urochloa humidicola]
MAPSVCYSATRSKGGQKHTCTSATGHHHHLLSLPYPFNKKMLPLSGRTPHEVERCSGSATPAADASRMRLRQQGGEDKSARMLGTRPAASWRSCAIRRAAASSSVGEDAWHSASDIKVKRRHTASGSVVERRRWTAWRGSGPSARQHRKATALKPRKQRSLS